jgi:hypothetical protein
MYHHTVHSLAVSDVWKLPSNGAQYRRKVTLFTVKILFDQLLIVADLHLRMTVTIVACTPHIR